MMGYPSETSPLLGNPRPDPVDRSKSIEEITSASFSLSSVSRRKKFILVSMAFVNFCACCCFSLLAPFFPFEAGKKGASQTVVGLIFGTFELVIVLSSPVFGNYISVIGCKFLYVSGILVCGVCAILFGILDKCPDGDIFIIMCFVCRSVEALGCSAFVTALFAILAYEFPENIITVMGTLETFSGLGMMVGPAIGGALYEAGGYSLPFFVMGATVLICGMITWRLMPDITDMTARYTGSMFDLLCSWLVVVTLVNILACSIALGFFDPTFANHLKQFNLKPWLIGMMFLIAPGVYALTAPLWGWLGDTKGYVRTMIATGSFGGIIALLLLGPMPLLTFIPDTLYINVISLACIGLFVGCTLIPTFKALLMGANSIGMRSNLDTYGKVSGFFNSSFSLGAFLGPTIGGALVDKYGFPWASTGIAGIFAFAGVLMVIYCIYKPKFVIPPFDDDQEVSVEQHEVQSSPVKQQDKSLNHSSEVHLQV